LPLRRKRQVRIVDPRQPRPRLPDPGRVPDDPFGPRSVSQHDLARPLNPRLIAFGLFGALVFGALVYNLFSLQVQQGAHFASLAEGNRVRAESVAAPRGILFDRHGTQMVTNRGSFAVAVVPADLPKTGQQRTVVLARLTKATGISADEVERVVRLHAAEPFQPFILKPNLDNDTYLSLTENLPEMPGVRLQTSSARHYLTDAGLSHILGYVGKLDPEEYNRLHDQGYLLDDSIGKTGLEYIDEKWLRGSLGRDVIETDANGRVVRHISTTDPVPGDNVYLSVDLNLQREVAADLQDGINKAKVAKDADVPLIRGGAAIVTNPSTGEVLSLVSLPDYDLNLFADGISTQKYQELASDPKSPLLNRAIDGLYPPGSTFKPVTASAGLQSGFLDKNKQIFCPGVFTRGNFNFLCWNRGGHHNQNVVEAIGHSCDVFFYTVADNIGDLVLSKYAQDFGVGHRTGIDLGPEARGIAPDRNWKKAYFADAYDSTKDPAWLDSYWYEGNTVTYGIGQSYLLVTPLQDLEWISTVANGGDFLKPQLTGRITAVDGSFNKPFERKVDHKVAVSPEALALVREGLRFAVAGPGGTGYLLRSLPQAAGKTGTAQFGVPDKNGSTPLHAWFTAVAPITDPEVAVTVFVEAGGEGSAVSEPVAAKILAYYFAHRDAIRGIGVAPGQGS
jgi:penicillin-binding protein 2